MEYDYVIYENKYILEGNLMNILQSSRKNIHVASAFRTVIFLVTGFHPDLQYRCELFFF